MVEDSKQHLQDFQQLLANCVEVADSFLVWAPSSLTVRTVGCTVGWVAQLAGLQCHFDANGVCRVSSS